MSTCVLCLEQNNAVERIHSHSNCGCEITVHRDCYDQYINRTIDATCLYCRRTRMNRQVTNIIDDIIHRLRNINSDNNMIRIELENIQNSLNIIANN